MLAGVPFGDGFQPSTGVSTFGDGSRPSWGRRTQRVPRLPTARSTRASRLDSLRSLRRLGFHIANDRSEEHTSELQSRQYFGCRLLIEKKKTGALITLGGQHSAPESDSNDGP